jgi:hypothetical protein
MSSIDANLQHVWREMEAARRQTVNGVSTVVSRADGEPVTLVAVSKTKPAAMLREAFQCGQRAFGENYVQEGVAKIAELADLRSDFHAEGIVWHFIGPLQSNKAKLVAQHFDWVHGVDRPKIAEALANHRQAFLSLPPLNVCIQVNVSGEATKSGVSPSDVLTLAKLIGTLSALKLRGLMTIIENTHDENKWRQQFRQMKSLRAMLATEGIVTDTLSMGMSQDFRVAIEEGATMVRIGSAIFGSRT